MNMSQPRIGLASQAYNTLGTEQTLQATDTNDRLEDRQ